jgi:hypothetical protein
MRDRSDATTANAFRTSTPASGRSRSKFVQRAPGPEAPETRDRRGAQRGMALLLVGGGLFWLGVAAAAVYLLN